MAYFTMEEFLKSDVAEELGIDNTPNERDMENLKELIEIMEKIRVRWTEWCEKNDKPDPRIIVTSGFRCDALNEAVKGSKTSQHRTGSAVDFIAANKYTKSLYGVIVGMLNNGEIEVSQLINENSWSWIHLGLYEGGKFNQLLNLCTE